MYIIRYTQKARTLCVDANEAQSDFEEPTGHQYQQGHVMPEFRCCISAHDYEGRQILVPLDLIVMGSIAGAQHRTVQLQLTGHCHVLHYVQFGCCNSIAWFVSRFRNDCFAGCLWKEYIQNMLVRQIHDVKIQKKKFYNQKFINFNCTKSDKSSKFFLVFICFRFFLIF